MFRSFQIYGSHSIRNTFFKNPKDWRVEKRALEGVGTLIKVLNIPTDDSSDGTFHILKKQDEGVDDKTLALNYLRAHNACEPMRISPGEDTEELARDGGFILDTQLPEFEKRVPKEIPEVVLRNAPLYELYDSEEERPRNINPYNYASWDRKAKWSRVHMWSTNMNIFNKDDPNAFAKINLEKIHDWIMEQSEVLIIPMNRKRWHPSTLKKKQSINVEKYKGGIPGSFLVDGIRQYINICTDREKYIQILPISELNPNYARVVARNYAIIHLLTGFGGVYGETHRLGGVDIESTIDEIPEVVLRYPNNYEVTIVGLEDSIARVKYKYVSGDADTGINTFENIARVINACEGTSFSLSIKYIQEQKDEVPTKEPSLEKEKAVQVIGRCPGKAMRWKYV